MTAGIFLVVRMCLNFPKIPCRYHAGSALYPLKSLNAHKKSFRGHSFSASMGDISGEYFESFSMYDNSRSATKTVKRMHSDNESETNQTESYLDIELKRLTVEERTKRDQYNDSKMELQEIWNKVVGLQTYIHGLLSEIENIKIECITSCPNSSNSNGEDGSWNFLTTESASRLADIQILKEKIRTKEGLRTRSAVLADKLASSRRQLSQLTDSLNKSVAHDNMKGSAADANALIPYTHHGSIASSMNLRNLLIETARSIDQLESDLARTNAEHDLLERELNAALNSDAYSDIFRTDGHTNSGNSKRLTTPMKLLSAGNSSNNNSNDFSSANKIKPVSVQRQTPAHKLDASLLDIITHGTPLSDDLVAALTSGSAFNRSTVHEREDRQRQVLEGDELQCELTLADILSGTAANVTRMNGEEPAAYLVRLQRRLSGLGVLEAQVQSEFEAKVSEVKELRDKLQDVELKRLRVELQVSNMRAGQTKQQTNSSSSSSKKKDRSTDYYEVLRQDKQRQLKKASGSVPTQSNPLIDRRNARAAAAVAAAESPTNYTADDSGNAGRSNQRRAADDDSNEDSDDHSAALNTSAVVDFEDIYRSRSQSQSESRGGRQQSPSKRATTQRDGAMTDVPLSPTFNPLASNEAVSRYSKRASKGSVPAIAVNAGLGGDGILKPKQRRESSGKLQPQAQSPSRRRSSVDEMLQGHISESTYESMTMAKHHRERQQQLRQQLSDQKEPPLSPSRKSNSNRKNSSAGKRSPRGGRRLSGGSKASPLQSPNKSNKSPSSSQHYEASILEQLLKHSQMLGDQTDPRSIDHNFLVQQHDEVNRLILLYLASSESNSALSTQLKVKVLSKLLSRDLTSGDVRELIDFSHHNEERGGGGGGDDGDSESVSSRDLDDFRHVPQELRSHSQSRGVVPDRNQHRERNTNTKAERYSQRNTNHNSSLNNEVKPFPDRLEGLLFSPSSSASPGGSTEGARDRVRTGRSPERRSLRESRDAHIGSERTPMSSPNRSAHESKAEHAPFVSTQTKSRNVETTEYKPERVSHKDSSDDDEVDDDFNDEVEIFDETHSINDPPVTAQETASQTAVVMIPPKTPWTNEDRRGPDTPVVANNSSKNQALVATSASSSSQCLNRGSLAILTSPCGCKYCQPDNYEYRTMYDRNGRYIGPPELRPSGSRSNSVSRPPSTSMGTNTDSLSRPGSAGSGRRDVYLHSYFSPAETDQMILRRRSEGVRSADGSHSHDSSFSVFGSTKRPHRRSQSVGALDRRRSGTTAADTSTMEDGRVLFPLSPTHKPTFSSQLHSRVASPYFDDKNEFDRKHILQSLNKEHITVSSGGRADKRRHSFSGTSSNTIQRLRSGSTARNSTGNQQNGDFESADGTDTGEDTRFTAEEKQAHRAHSTPSTALTRSMHDSALSAEDSLPSSFVVGKPYIGCRLCSRVRRNRASEGNAHTSAILNDDGEVEGIEPQQPTQPSLHRITSSFGRTDKKTISPIRRKSTLTNSSSSNNRSSSNMISSVNGKRRQVPANKDSQDGLSEMLAALTADDGTGNVDLLAESSNDVESGMKKKSSFVFAEDILTTPVLPLLPPSFRSRPGSKDHAGGVDPVTTSSDSQQQGQHGPHGQNQEAVPPDMAQKRLNESYQAFLSLLKQSNISHETILSAIDHQSGGTTSMTTRSRNGSHASVSGHRSSTKDRSSSSSSSFTGLLSSTALEHRQSVNAVVQRLQEMADELEQSQVNVRRDLLASMSDDGGGFDGEYQRLSPDRAVRQTLQNAEKNEDAQFEENNTAEPRSSLEQKIPLVAEQNTPTPAAYDDDKTTSAATMDSLSAALQRIETHHQSVRESIRSTGSDILNSSMRSQGEQSQSGGFNPNMSLRSHTSTLLGVGGVQSIRSGYLQHTLDRQQREIDELRRTQRALEVLLQSDAQISQLRSSQQILMALLEGSNTSDDYKHLLQSTDVLVGDIAALRQGVSCQSLQSNLGGGATNAAVSDHNRVFPESLLKSPAYVRARSRSNSRGSEDDMAERHGEGRLGSHSDSYTEIHSASRMDHSADKRLSRSADQRTHHNDESDDDEVAAVFREGGGFGEEEGGEGNGGYSSAPNSRRKAYSQQQGVHNNTFFNNIQTVPADHPAAQHYLSPAVYDEMVQFLTHRVSLCSSKYAQFATQETVDPVTGIAHNPDGSSKGYIDITLIAARNLPEMKRLQKSADAYAEITLVTVGLNSYSSDNARHDLYKFSPPELLSIISTAQSGGMDVGNHSHSHYRSPPSSPRNYRHYDQSPQRRSRSGSGSGSVELYHAITDGFQRTTVKAETLFPEWREHFRFSGLRSLTSQAVLMTLRDSSRVGHQINIKDAGIGQLVLPLSMPLLRNQNTHSMWVDLQPMPAPPLNASDYTRRVPVVKLPSNCAVKVELKLFYSHTRYWQDQRTESQDLLDSLNTLYHDYTRQVQGHQQAVTHNIYARDKAVLDRIHRLMVKHGFRKSIPMSGFGGGGRASDSRVNASSYNNPRYTAGMTQRESKIRRYVIVGLREQQRNAPAFSPRSANKSKQISPQSTRRYQQPQAQAQSKAQSPWTQLQSSALKRHNAQAFNQEYQPQYHQEQQEPRSASSGGRSSSHSVSPLKSVPKKPRVSTTPATAGINRSQLQHEQQGQIPFSTENTPTTAPATVELVEPDTQRTTSDSIEEDEEEVCNPEDDHQQQHQSSSVGRPNAETVAATAANIKTNSNSSEGTSRVDLSIFKGSRGGRSAYDHLVNSHNIQQAKAARASGRTQYAFSSTEKR